ncbi:unnamed protein product [Cuscuta campestris]|uniref:Disease resistance R13L4/SHOC-2-like LRR domain-containing protein n=1 Tax=Cuscuta campestris TaxID=132261 RepID=A0A484KW53_9ASTE|nr:unnamed protein product [Cuscuta campestris]
MKILLWVFKIFVIFTFFVQLSSSICAEWDKITLLQFKGSIVKDTTNQLATWTNSTDCCGGGWDGIQCNETSGRVTGLSLQNSEGALYMKGTLSPKLGQLQFLETLIITGMHRIEGEVPWAIFPNLTHLQQLVLDDNALQGTIPTDLGHLPALQVLSLKGNRLSGQVPPALGKLRTLQVLILASNSLSGPIPIALQNFTSLQFIDLSHNQFSGPIPDFLGQLRNLTSIDLSNNRLSGQLPVSLKNLKNVTFLSFEHNRITGGIPPEIGNMTSLATLSLGSNGLTGRIPDSIASLPGLWNLSVPKNNLSNPLPVSFSKALLSIDLSYNNFTLGRSVPEWVTSRGLYSVSLAGCKLEGTLPKFTNPGFLTSIDLSDNALTGEGLSSFFANMSTLQKAKISSNRLREDISKIKIPETLSFLDLHANDLQGTMSGLLNNQTSTFLEAVDLSTNRISGRIPEFVFTPGLRGLKVLNAANNNITGSIPDTISNLEGLVRLDLRRNGVSGAIPEGLGKLGRLEWLDLSINGLTGRIPESLLGIKRLSHANFRANRLCGQIPQGKPFNIFPPAAYAHNMGLCGKPLPPCKNNKTTCQ